ncbi:MAG: trigger factor [Chloroflexota bacterium]
MKVSTEIIPDCQAVLTIEVEQERLDQAREESYRRLAARTVIPGFRKGKAPRSMVERHLGKERIYEDALQGLLPKVYREAVKESGIKALALPDLEVTQREPLVLKATIPLQPEVELGNYRGVRVQPESVFVTDEQVEAALREIQEQHAEWVPVEGQPARIGDRVVIDLRATLGDRTIANDRGILYPLIADSDVPAPGFSLEVAGMSPGETREFKVRYPEGYYDRALAGQEADFEVALYEVKEKHLPPVDDALAKTVGDFADLEALKTRLRENMQARAEAEARQRLVDRVVAAVVEGAKVQFPPLLVEEELERMVQRRRDNLRRQGLTLEGYLGMRKRTEEEFREELRPRARERAKTGLVLMEVARAENISVAPTDVDREIEEISQANGERSVRVRRGLSTERSRRNIEDILLERKIVDRLVEIATAKEGGLPSDFVVVTH